jgi:D-alanine-D-alanine ligase
MHQNPLMSKITEYNGKGRHIAVLHGGISREREISNLSAKSVIPVLLSMGYRITGIDAGLDLANILFTMKPDVVFNCLHGTYGEDGYIPSMLNSLEIPYTHSGAKSSAICFNKDITRRLCTESGILVPKGETIEKGKWHTSIQLPYVVKPTAQGSSIAVDVMFPEDNRSIRDYSFECGDLALVEEYIKGMEMEVVVLAGKALALLEVKVPGRRLFDYQAKYTFGLAEYISSPNISAATCDEILAIAEKAYNTLYCRGLTRVEFIYVPETQQTYFLEINTHPGLTPTSVCPRIAANAGISFAELLEMMLSDARYD